MNITISKPLQNRITVEQVEAALKASRYRVSGMKRFNVVRIKGDALDMATGRALHAAVFSTQRRELVINAYPADGSPYRVYRVAIS